MNKSVGSAGFTTHHVLTPSVSFDNNCISHQFSIRVMRLKDAPVSNVPSKFSSTSVQRAKRVGIMSHGKKSGSV